MERKHPLVIDRSAETGGDTREAAFNKVDKELDNIIGSANSIKEELGALAAEVEAMEPVDTSSFAKKTEIPKIVSGSGIRVVVTGQENKISADIPIASGIESGLMSSADKISLDGLKAQEPIFEGHIVDPDKHLPEILAADTGKVLEATSTGAKWTTPASGGVTSLNGLLGNLTLSGTGAAAVSTAGGVLTVNVPSPPVTSVNGKTGAVVIDTGSEAGGGVPWVSEAYEFWGYLEIQHKIDTLDIERARCDFILESTTDVAGFKAGDITTSAYFELLFSDLPLLLQPTLSNSSISLPNYRSGVVVNRAGSEPVGFFAPNWKLRFRIWK